MFKDIRECLRYQIAGCQCGKAEKGPEIASLKILQQKRKNCFVLYLPCLVKTTCSVACLFNCNWLNLLLISAEDLMHWHWIQSGCEQIAPSGIQTSDPWAQPDQRS